METDAFNLMSAAEEKFIESYGAGIPDAFSLENRREWEARFRGLPLAEARLQSSAAIKRFVKVVESWDKPEHPWTPEDSKELSAILHDELDRQKTAYRQLVMPIEEAHGQAMDRTSDALDALIEVAPTTLQGLAVLLKYLSESDFGFADLIGKNTERMTSFLAMITKAVDRLTPAEGAA